nr:ARID DNA-binding domain-containing protein [Tanacetum cinerariifolium]
MGHIVKFCPMDNKDEDMVMKTDTRNLAKERNEGFKTTKPTVMLKYPESIHFSTTCMIKGTDHANWDDIWYISNHIDKHLCYKLDSFRNIKEDFSVKKLENQKKFLFTYGIGEVLIEDGGQGNLVPGVHYAPEVTLNILSMDLLEKQGFEIKYDSNRCTLVYMFNNKETQNFDEDRMRKQDDIVSQESDFFRNRFNKVVKWFYNHYLERSLPGPIPPTINGVQTARAPQQEYNGGNNQPILKKPTKEIEEGKDRNCLTSHQWDFGETGAPIRKIAVPKGKETLEHFDVKLEDTRDSQDQPILTHSTRNQNLQGILLRPVTSRMTGSGDSSSSKMLINIESRVLESIYGREGVVGESVTESGRWTCISFWGDRWVDSVRLMDRFPRLFHLDRCKESVVVEKGRWVEGTWRWVWDWVREPRGRVVGAVEALQQVIRNPNITLSCRDKWKWVLDDSGVFTVKALSELVEVKCINVGNHNSETTWNNLVPKKVNIFAWRAIHGRLPVRVELDKKGIDLHTILCPHCDEMCETIDHSIVFCNEAMKIWEKVFDWWNLQMVNVFSTKDMLRHNGDRVTSTNYKKLWQSLVWTTGYYIWKNRNCHVFGKKVKTASNLFHEIRLRAFEWIVKRSSKYKVIWDEWIAQPGTCMGSGGTT